MSRIVVACIVAIWVGSSIRAAEPTTKPSPNEQVAELKKLLHQFAGDLSDARTEKETLKQQLTQLRSENIRLKAQLAAVEADRVRENAQPRPSPFSLTIPPGQNPQQPGKDWKPFEYQGRTVYVVPLQ